VSTINFDIFELFLSTLQGVKITLQKLRKISQKPVFFAQNAIIHQKKYFAKSHNK